MSVGVLALVIAAAFAHAGWNFLAKGAEGGAGVVWLCAAVGSVIWVPVLAGPLLSGAAAIVFLGERPSALALAGGLIIVGAVFALVGRAHGSREAVIFAVLTGVAMASYTLWDKHAVGPSELSPVVYYWGTNLTVALVLLPFVLRRGGRRAERGAAARIRRRPAQPARLRARPVRALAPVSVVAPARETSILVGVLLGTTVLGEGEGHRRLIAAAAIVLGVTALALG